MIKMDLGKYYLSLDVVYYKREDFGCTCYLNLDVIHPMAVE